MSIDICIERWKDNETVGQTEQGGVMEKKAEENKERKIITKKGVCYSESREDI